jgi:hypothetical protein
MLRLIAEIAELKCRCETLRTLFMTIVAYVGRRGLNASRPVNINQIVAVNSLAATQFGLAVGSRPFDTPSLPVGARFANRAGMFKLTTYF